MSARYPRAVCGLVLAAALAGVAAPARYAIAQNTTQADEPSGDSATAAAEPAGTSRKSSYTPAKETCGTAPLAFPRVAHRHAGGLLRRPRGEQGRWADFPANDRAGAGHASTSSSPTWAAGAPSRAGCCCSIRQAAEGKRIKVLMTKLDFPHGLADRHRPSHLRQHRRHRLPLRSAGAAAGNDGRSHPSGAAGTAARPCPTAAS